LFPSLEIREKIRELEKTSGIHIHETAKLLAKIRRYHNGVYQHSINVARLAAQFSTQLRLSAIEIYILTVGALFHDIGKTQLPHSILDKQGKLSQIEWDLVKKHPEDGVSLVSQYDWAQQLKPMILLHHERLDGKGYYSVPSENIPLSARIVSIADAFDAMMSPRPYQRQRSIQACWEEIKKCSGTQFDPELLPAFYFAIINPEIRL